MPPNQDRGVKAPLSLPTPWFELIREPGPIRSGGVFAAGTAMAMNGHVTLMEALPVGAKTSGSGSCRRAAPGINPTGRNISKTSAIARCHRERRRFRSLSTRQDRSRAGDGGRAPAVLGAGVEADDPAPRPCPVDDDGTPLGGLGAATV